MRDGIKECATRKIVGIGLVRRTTDSRAICFRNDTKIWPSLTNIQFDRTKMEVNWLNRNTEILPLFIGLTLEAEYLTFHFK